MDAEAKKLFAGDTWAIDGDRREVEDTSVSYPIDREYGFQEDYSENANPDREVFNQILCEVVAACKETLYGIIPWDKDVTYQPDSFTQVNGAIYHTLTSTTGVNPLDTNQTVWERIGNRISRLSEVPSTIVAANIFIDNTRSDRFKVYWNPPDDGGSDITSTRLRYSKESDFSSGVTTINDYSPGDSINISARDSDLYYVRLRFTNEVGNSVESASVRVRSAPLTPPAVTGFTPDQVYSSAISLSWNPVSPANGLVINNYRIEWKSGAEDFSNTANPARHRDTTDTLVNIDGLTNGILYTFRIIVVSNRSTENAGTFTASISPLNHIRVPSKPTISATGGVQQITAAATNVPASNGRAITSYEWQYKLSSAAAWTDATDTIAPITSIASLSAGDYNLRMRAVNSIGNGEWSDVVNATVTSA